MAVLIFFYILVLFCIVFLTIYSLVLNLDFPFDFVYGIAARIWDLESVLGLSDSPATSLLWILD